MLTQGTLTWIVTIVFLLIGAFLAGFEWPHKIPDFRITDQPEQIDLSLKLTDDQLKGQAPKNASLMFGQVAFSPDEDVKIPLDKAFPINLWTENWSITLDLDNPEVISRVSKNVSSPEKRGGGSDLSQANNQASGQTSSEHNFVASKSGSKYHPVNNCSYADRIKPENKIFFVTEEEARGAGYLPSSCFK